jgi:hypothetical protein
MVQATLVTVMPYAIHSLTPDAQEQMSAHGFMNPRNKVYVADASIQALEVTTWKGVAEASATAKIT